MQKHGMMANAEASAQKPFTCTVCKSGNPGFSWTDLSGEGYCLQCGTPYQLKWGEPNGREYPYCTIKESWLPTLRAFWEERHTTNGQGSFLFSREYQDQFEGRKAFDEWLLVNYSRFQEIHGDLTEEFFCDAKSKNGGCDERKT